MAPFEFRCISDDLKKQLKGEKNLCAANGDLQGLESQVQNLQKHLFYIIIKFLYGLINGMVMRGIAFDLNACLAWD